MKFKTQRESEREREFLIHASFETSVFGYLYLDYFHSRER